MACRLAEALEGEADVVLAKKLRAPGWEEVAIGSVGERGDVHLATPFLADEGHLRHEIRDRLEELRRCRERYTPVRPAVDPAGRVAIVVDDGAATGMTMVAAVHAVRARAPARLFVALGVASSEAVDRLELVADRVVCVLVPPDLETVGAHYEDFRPVTDEEVVEALRLTNRAPGVHS